MIQYKVKNNIALITMDSAPVNALGLLMREALVNHLHQAFNDDAGKAVVVSSTLPRVCAGADI